MPSHKILKISPPQTQLQTSLTQALGISEITAQVLLNRGIKTVAEADAFVNVKTAHFLDPYQFSQMPKAVSLIKQAAEKKEKVMVFGDYDVDGLTALALLKGTLLKLGLEVEHYLPHRIKDGYGLSKNIVALAKQKQVRLLITVDCGISNHKEIAELRRNNIEVIITDHHQPTNPQVPMASSIINPKVKGSSYPFRDLAGVGVAYKLCKALCGCLLLDELDLVCLGTIADSVPLTGENRVIAKEGLLRLAQTRKLGLRALMENAGIQNKKFTATYVSFILAPRLNASGRMDTAETSLNLLLSQTPKEAQDFARIVETHNRQRQKIENQVLEEAEAIINREINFKEHKIIVLAKEGWHQGVLGIVASKIADRFYRPAIVISLNEDLCKGSGRSIENFHLFEALLSCQESLSAFGGHSHAVGMLIPRDNIAEFKEDINRLARERLSLTDLLPSLEIDLELSFADLTQEVFTELETLEPFGKGNPEPLFYTRQLKLKGQPQLLSRDTLKFWVTDGEVTFPAIGFGMGGFHKDLIAAEGFDLVYTTRLDEWQDERSALLEVRDIFFR